MSHSVHAVPAPHTTTDEQEARRPWTVLGLMLAALTLARLSSVYDRPGIR